MKNIFNKLRIVVLIFIAIFIMINYSYAGLFDYQITVSKIATDTEQAKKDAIYEARLTALKNVMQKITSIKYNKKIIKNLDIATAVNFEKGFQINNEQFFKGQYVANITFLFDKTKVITFLDENNIPYSESKGMKYLIIFNQQQLDMLPDINVWTFYWKNYKAEDFTSEVQIAESNKIDINNQDALKQLKAQLELQDIFVIDVNTIQPADDIAKNISADAPVPEISYLIKIKSVLLDYHLSAETNNFADAFMFIMQAIDNKNKDKIFARYSHKSDNLILKIDTSDYEKRIAIEQKIKNITGVSNIFVTEIDYGSIKLHVSYKDTMAILQKEFTKQCIDFNLNTLYLELYDDCAN